MGRGILREDCVNGVGFGEYTVLYNQFPIKIIVFYGARCELIEALIYQITSE